MTYSTTIPGPNDDPSDSQGQLLTNFSQLNTQFTVDHINLTSATDNGEHRKITLNNVIGAHAAPVDPKSLIFSDAVAAISELFFENANGQEQLTNLTITSTGTRRHIVTPWGIHFDFGTAPANTNGTAITFQTAFPNNVFMLVQGVQANVAAAPRTVTYSVLAVTGFTAFTSNNGLVFSYFAIGN